MPDIRQQQQVQQQQQQSGLGISEQFQHIMKAIESLGRDLTDVKKAIEQLQDKVTGFEKHNKARAEIRRGIKNPRRLNLVFMNRMTIGDLLQKHIRKDEYPSVAEEIGIGEKELANLIEDRLLPDRNLSEKLFFYLNKKHGIRYSQFMICKAHTYSKMKYFSEKQ